MKTDDEQTMTTTSTTGGNDSIASADDVPLRFRRMKRQVPRSGPVIAGVDPHHPGQGRLLAHREKLIRVTAAGRSLEMLYQPIFELRSGGVVGVEALARFAPQPIRPPDVWFTEAASVGLGVDLEVTALNLALEQLHRLPVGLYLSLNASVEAITSEQFGAILNDVPAERIVLELTEHTPIDDYSTFEASLRKVRSRGVRLAVDDAGAGFSSLRHILNLQPEVIKLDIGLIRGIDRDPARQALGRALLGFAKEAYNASIVAEGIETEGELDTLRDLGCPCGQGFYLGRPERLPLNLSAPAFSETFWLPGDAVLVTR
ncbi:MAG: EAL domain-containing protein [Acidimicrobiales bacterium]